MSNFNNQFIHDAGHRRAVMPEAEPPLMPIRDVEPPAEQAPLLDAGPPSEALFFFFLGVSDVLDVLDGLVGLYFFCICLSPHK